MDCVIVKPWQTGNLCPGIYVSEVLKPNGGFSLVGVAGRLVEPGTWPSLVQGRLILMSPYIDSSLA